MRPEPLRAAQAAPARTRPPGLTRRDALGASLSRGAVAGLLGVPVVLCVALLWALDGLPYQDAPNHLSRAVVMADLVFRDGREFGTLFSLDWQFVPYLLGDLFHLGTVVLLPPYVAGRVWMIVSVLALPAAVYVLLRTWGATPFLRVAGPLFALYLAVDWFLALGFISFRYGLALAVLGLATWERTWRDGGAWWVAWLGAIVACYLTHLAALVFLVAMVGALSASRLLEDRRRLLPLAALAAPLLLLFLWHVLLRPGHEAGESLQPGPLSKLLRTAASIAFFRQPAQVAVALAFLGLLAAPLLAVAPRRWPRRAVEALAISAAFFAIYLVLPEQRGEVWGVDIRALPLAWLFAALGALMIAERAPRLRPALLGGGVVLAVANLAVFAVNLLPANATMQSYRVLVRNAPPGAFVLPVATAPRIGMVSPTIHAASFATVEAGAVVPYTFTGDQGAPIEYFNFRVAPPRYPWQWWYVHRDQAPEWDVHLAGFEFLLVQLPVDWERLPARVEPLAGNDAAVLVRNLGPRR